MSQYIPQATRRLGRGTTAAAARRNAQIMCANVNNPSQSDVINTKPGMFCEIWDQDTGQGVTAGHGATIQFSQALIDPSSWWSAGSPTKITLPVAGYYAYSFNLGGFVGGSGVNGYAQILLNDSGGTPNAIGFSNPFVFQVIDGLTLSMGFSGIAQFKAGDAITAAINLSTVNMTFGDTFLSFQLLQAL